MAELRSIGCRMLLVGLVIAEAAWRFETVVLSFDTPVREPGCWIYCVARTMSLQDLEQGQRDLEELDHRLVQASTERRGYDAQKGVEREREQVRARLATLRTRKVILKAVAALVEVSRADLALTGQCELSPLATGCV